MAHPVAPLMTVVGVLTLLVAAAYGLQLVVSLRRGTARWRGWRHVATFTRQAEPRRFWALVGMGSALVAIYCALGVYLILAAPWRA